jgi:histidinol-phosphate/aromatic aminotransferase/cobyric acid decarboxylase-like protein
VTDDEVAQAWADFEQEWADRARLKGFALACAEQAVASREELERAVDAVQRARKRAERALVKFKRDVELAEHQARIVVELCG